MTARKIHILIVDDERPVRRLLRTILGQDFDISEAETGEEGIRMAATTSPDLVLLDLGLPDIDGITVIRRLREWSAIPILVLSARGQEPDKVVALDTGADDYLTKPFSAAELLARIRVSLRHRAQTSSQSPESIVVLGALAIDLARRTVHRDGVELHLTPIEWKLLAVLARHVGMVMTHRQILKEVWGPGVGDRTHYLRVHMASLRRKIESNPNLPELLRTETGVGYRLCEKRS